MSCTWVGFPEMAQVPVFRSNPVGKSGWNVQSVILPDREGTFSAMGVFAVNKYKLSE
jgi:hypothetical protein